VNRTFHRRLWVLLISAAAGVGVWKWAPIEDCDRVAFTTVARSFYNPPWVASGRGTHARPWALHAFSAESKPDPAQAPAVVSLGDDRDGVFQSSPPAPIDLAVIFSNLQRLGIKKTASAAVLSWENPDPIGLAAVEKSLARFDSLVMAAPLSRSAVSSSIPPAFRRASLPLTAIHGDVSALPLVNRIPIPGVVFGSESSLAGFSVLESESTSRWYPLLARWEDRVVFAFPVLAVLQRFNLPVEGMEVQLGKFLKLSSAGPVVAIDEFGRLAVPLKPLPALAEIPAPALIDGRDDLFAKLPASPPILRDDQSAADPATRVFSKNLAASMSAIASNAGLGAASFFPRLAMAWEIVVLSGLAILLAAFAGASDFVRRLSGLVITGACLSAQWIAFAIASVWLPALPILAVISAALVIGELIREKSSATP
jgi:hypothetical protein